MENPRDIEARDSTDWLRGRMNTAKPTEGPQNWQPCMF